jgi:hypothetical protein
MGKKYTAGQNLKLSFPIASGITSKKKSTVTLKKGMLDYHYQRLCSKGSAEDETLESKKAAGILFTTQLL